MSVKRIIKGSLISLAVLGMVGGSMNSTIANAKHRHVHYTRRIKRTRRSRKRGKLYRRHDRIRYSYRNRRRSYKRNRHTRHPYVKRHFARKVTHKKITRLHGKYVWGLIPDANDYMHPEKVQIISGYNSENPLVRIMNNHAAKKFCRKTNISSSSLYSSRSHANRAANKWNKDANNGSSATINSSPGNDTPSNNYTPSKKHSGNSTERNIAEIKAQTLTDINNDRTNNGLQPVQENPAMDQIANMRAKQTTRDFTHYDPNTNQPYELEDADKLDTQFGKGNYVFTENLGGSALGEMEAMPSGAPAYYNRNGKDMANNVNDYYMKYDTSSNPSTNWGHRNNILYAPWRYVGIGAAEHGDGEYDIAEDFATWVNK